MGRRNLPANTPIQTAGVPGFGQLWPVWSVLVICVWIAFSPIFNNGFVDWDDKAQILENHSFRGLGWEQVRFAFTNFTGGVCQPVGWLLQSLTYEMFGLDPWGYHLGSLLFHIVNVVLFTYCASRWSRGPCRTLQSVVLGHSDGCALFR